MRKRSNKVSDLFSRALDRLIIRGEEKSREVKRNLQKKFVDFAITALDRICESEEDKKKVSELMTDYLYIEIEEFVKPDKYGKSKYQTVHDTLKRQFNIFEKVDEPEIKKTGDYIKYVEALKPIAAVVHSNLPFSINAVKDLHSHISSSVKWSGRQDIDFNITIEELDEEKLCKLFVEEWSAFLRKEDTKALDPFVEFVVCKCISGDNEAIEELKHSYVNAIISVTGR